MKTQIEQVSQWIVDLNFPDIPEEVKHFAKLQLLDAYAAICAGSRSDFGEKLYDSLKHVEAGGPCTLLTTGEKWSMDNCIYYHSAMINSLELDTFVYMGHIGQSSVSAVLSVSEILDSSFQDSLLALICATEVAGRLSAYMAAGSKQGHMRSFIHRSAGAVVAAKLLRLDQEKTSQAISIALSMPEDPLFPSAFSPDTKVICTSVPTIEGVKAAFMALEGIDAAKDILEHPLGLFKSVSYSKYIPNIWGHMDKTWVSLTISSKKYATCGYAQGPVSAALDIVQQHKFSHEDIIKVTVYAPLVTSIMEMMSTPHFGAGITPVNTHFSTRRSVAAALIYKDLSGDFFKSGTFEKKIESIEKLTDKINLKHSWQLTSELIKGLDQGMANPGKPGFLTLVNGSKTIKRYKSNYGERQLFKWADVKEILGLPGSDLSYFRKRYFQAVKGKFQMKRSKEFKHNNFSHEEQLENMVFRLSGRVEVELKDGKTFKSTCMIPPGFLGNPNRENVIMEKYYRETEPVLGRTRAESIKKSIFGNLSIS